MGKVIVKAVPVTGSEDPLCPMGTGVKAQLVPMKRKFGSIYLGPHTPSWRSA
jgi:hypothetical protein